MDVTENHCIVCNRKLTGKQQRALYCSGACKIKDFRYKRQGNSVTPTSVDVTEIPGKHNDAITVTDQAFIDDAAARGLMNWYNFSKELYERKCIWNGKLFSTHLKLNKFCSPECRDKTLKGLSGIKEEDSDDEN